MYPLLQEPPSHHPCRSSQRIWWLLRGSVSFIISYASVSPFSCQELSRSLRCCPTCKLTSQPASFMDAGGRHAPETKGFITHCHQSASTFLHWFSHSLPVGWCSGGRIARAHSVGCLPREELLRRESKSLMRSIKPTFPALEENILWLLRGCSLYNKVAWNKNSQRLCRQDTQKSKRPQEESSPTFGSKYFL